MTTRRDFIKKAGVAGSGLALGQLSPSIMTNPARKGEKVKLACIGIGFRGGEIIKELNKTGLAEIVALCDIDMGAKHTQEIAAMFPNAKQFQDFRKMFDSMGNQIEAVSIGIPDFAHYVVAVS